MPSCYTDIFGWNGEIAHAFCGANLDHADIRIELAEVRMPVRD
jgi:hypothetical protein